MQKCMFSKFHYVSFPLSPQRESYCFKWKLRLVEYIVFQRSKKSSEGNKSSEALHRISGFIFLSEKAECKEYLGFRGDLFNIVFK